MVDTDVFVEREFVRIGARAAIRSSSTTSINIRRDRRGEYFELEIPGQAAAYVLDRSRADRHLLLLVKERGAKSRFLCGHDERHWFVAAIPESERGITSIQKAKFALQPLAVRELALSLRSKNRVRRHNSAFVRQGEWFFVPVADLQPNLGAMLHNEPLSRGRGKMHWMQHAFRRGGIQVYVNREFPNGLTQAEFDALPDTQRNGRRWAAMVRDAEVFAKGWVRHPDHATVVLQGWHRVFMNTETQARAMRYLVFLD
jgi:hypothetical protein